MDGFHESPVGPVPRVRTVPTISDRLGTVRVRVGILRDSCTVVPGLYCVGSPDASSPVIVTANYKLSFDCVRFRLAGRDVWILVLDTRGINVWCAAGKGLFSDHEVCRVVRNSSLHKVVSHRKLILPQLAAPGTAAHQVRRGCGFEVTYGPIRASDIPAFLDSGGVAVPEQRMITFSLKERAELVPVEIVLFLKVAAPVLAALWLLAGFGQGGFSLSRAWTNVLPPASALALGMLSGGILVPVLLPWIPGRRFFTRGLLLGAGVATVALFSSPHWPGLLQGGAVVLGSAAVSGWMAMNFTGSTPFTSPSGVEKEMRTGIPTLAGLAVMGALSWLAGLLP